MKKSYYDYTPPFSKELESMYYRPTSVSHKVIFLIQEMFNDPRDNSIYELFSKQKQKRVTLYAMSRYALKIYAHYINNPVVYGKDTHNIIGWMIRAMKNAFLSIHSITEDTEKYYPLHNRFVNRYKDRVLDILLSDAEICAAKRREIFG